MPLTEMLKQILILTAQQLKGSARRLFMARIVQALGKGGQRQAQRELHWCRDTIRKGTRELESGIECVDAFTTRGRKPAEAHLPHLIKDIRDLVESQSQTDPTFQTQRLYRRLSSATVRHQLIQRYGYTDSQLPSEETIRVKLNALGYHPCRVAKSKPLKKRPETDAIFEQLHRINAAADEDPTQLRLSLDAKATVLLGHLSRGGTSRVKVHAWDHDFAEGKVTPFGILLPAYDELYLYFTHSSVTSDFIVDCLYDVWEQIRSRFPDVDTLVLNQDNGPEVQSHRTQFMHRLVAFVDTYDLNLQLAYYPPYHSKYNPIERAWGVLERHWNGTLLDSLETVLQFASTMTWKDIQPMEGHPAHGAVGSEALANRCQAHQESHAGIRRTLAETRRAGEMVCQYPAYQACIAGRTILTRGSAGRYGFLLLPQQESPNLREISCVKRNPVYSASNRIP